MFAFKKIIDEDNHHRFKDHANIAAKNMTMPFCSVFLFDFNTSILTLNGS